MSAPLDKAGHEIKIGDHIVYGHALGRCVGLRFGRVVAITEKKTYRGDPKHHFTVMSIDDDGGGIARLNRRKGTLQFAERLLVIDAKILPDYYQALLRKLPELAPVRKPLVCDDCETADPTTKETTCPYSEDVNGTTITVHLCDHCYTERAMSI
jgi:hypothetical protein